MTSASTGFQADFLHHVQARRAGQAPAPGAPAWAASPAFAVYANTGLNACVQALEANYPSVAHWLMAPWFRPVAAAFARAQPPRDARLFLYGEGFPAYLATLEPDSEWPYLSDLARLDRAWTEVHAAADGTPLDATRFAAQVEALGDGVQLRPAPTTRWHFRAGMPLWDLWTLAREDRSLPPAPPGGACGVLLTRPDDAVLAHPLDAPGQAFLDACARGRPLADAADAAFALAPDLDLQHLLVTFFVQGVFADSGPGAGAPLSV